MEQADYVEAAQEAGDARAEKFEADPAAARTQADAAARAFEAQRAANAALQDQLATASEAGATPSPRVWSCDDSSLSRQPLRQGRLTRPQRERKLRPSSRRPSHRARRSWAPQRPSWARPNRRRRR